LVRVPNDEPEAAVPPPLPVGDAAVVAEAADVVLVPAELSRPQALTATPNNTTTTNVEPNRFTLNTPRGVVGRAADQNRA
jgi:hypothetical protein